MPELYVQPCGRAVTSAPFTQKTAGLDLSLLWCVCVCCSFLCVVSKEEVRDLIPDLKAWGGYVVDKVEGLAIFSDGTAWVSTDNDGVDDHSGETMFFTVGQLGTGY